MRDPRRIKRVLTLLESVWHKRPDLRLGQVLALVKVHGDLKPEGTVLFHVDDGEWEKALDELRILDMTGTTYR